MWMTNRKTRYEIIKELISNASPETIDELVRESAFSGYDKQDDPEYRRKELLSYLDEMHEYWTDNNIDVIDRQYITIVNGPTQVEERESEDTEVGSIRVNPRTYRKEIKKTNI